MIQILPERFESILPLAVKWAEAKEKVILGHGTALSPRFIQDVKTLGVKYPEQGARGSGHAKWFTLFRKCHKNVSKSALIDRFSSKTALLRDSTKNGTCKKTLYTRLCLAYSS